MSAFMLRRRFRSIMLMVLLFPLFAGTLSPQPLVMFTNGNDVIAHWGGFFMASLAVFSLVRERAASFFIFLLGLAVVLEAAQIFLDGRQVSAGDMSANLLGVCCAFFLITIFKAIRIQTSQA